MSLSKETQKIKSLYEKSGGTLKIEAKVKHAQDEEEARWHEIKQGVAPQWSKYCVYRIKKDEK